VEKICWTLQNVIAVTGIEMCCMCILPAKDEGTSWRVWGNVRKTDLNWDHLNTKQASWSARILIRFSVVFLSLSREISGLTHSPCSRVLLEKLTVLS